MAEALDSNLPVLKDFHYGWHTNSAKVSQRTVAAKARNRGLLPARTPTRSWTWYEWEYEPNLMEKICRGCHGKPGIEFGVVTNENGVINRFQSVEKKTWSLIGCFPVKSGSYKAVIMVALWLTTPGLCLTGSHWRRELVKRLTRGLTKLPGLNKRLSNRATCIIELDELNDLYHAGAA